MEDKIVYRFSKEKFKKIASRNIKERIKWILDDIENSEVDFSENEIHGSLIIDWYGVEHELYPVSKEWCVKTDI